MDDHHEAKDEMRCATSQKKTKGRGKNDCCPCNSTVNKYIRILTSKTLQMELLASKLWHSDISLIYFKCKTFV